MKIYKYDELGSANYGWLKTKYHFSFSSYYNPSKMHVGTLRVLNDDYISGNTGFDTHPHNDMEIITYIVDGYLTHQDSMNNKRTITSKQVQYMSAGTGITHSEKNESDKVLHLYQIWIFPREKGLTPNYGDYDFSDLIIQNQETLIVSGENVDNTILIQQDANISIGLFDKGTKQEIDSKGFKYTYLVLIDGIFEINGKTLTKGDAIEASDKYSIIVKEDVHYLLIRVNELDRR